MTALCVTNFGVCIITPESDFNNAHMNSTTLKCGEKVT